MRCCRNLANFTAPRIFSRGLIQVFFSVGFSGTTTMMMMMMRMDNGNFNVALHLNGFKEQRSQKCLE